jgi:BirA family transcriptional regulator, biotin operon repressor / biotin---[acetyl-CoA-carboxylase] ligase
VTRPRGEQASAGATTPPAGAALGHPRVHLRRTGSTNDRARELAIAGAPHGSLVSAAEQTAGRGRHGRRWWAPAGSSLLASLVLRWPASAPTPALLPLLAAVAVCDVVGESARIKWPNDVVMPYRTRTASPGLAKLGGILVESRPEDGWAVLGIGLNVAVRLEDLPAELQPQHADGSASPGLPAGTLGLSAAAVEPTLARLLGALERRLREPARQTLQAWRARDALVGREIAWGAHGPEGRVGAGRAKGIDGTGRLLVSLAGGGQVALVAGEVHLRRIG